MKHSQLQRGLMAVAISAAMSSSALATNGYFTHGIGTHSKAMAGAGDAMPTMAIDVANNPASGILVDDELNLGLAHFLSVQVLLKVTTITSRFLMWRKIGT